MRVLGIETSCDETGVALYDTNQGLLADCVYSQISLHIPYGGVVPELASRDHIRKLVPLIRQVLEQTSSQPSELDGLAYTAGPGLAGALLVGASVGRALAYALHIPAIAVHHLEGHLLAPMLSTRAPSFPFVALLVSGGHTALIEVKALGRYRLLGETLDDAAGEAFDKTARLLGLPYPGGKELEQLAAIGQPGVYRFPRPLVRQGGLDFSFSGLKTFALNTWQKSDQSQQTKANIAHAFQEAVIETLAIKCRWALEQTHCQRLVVSGGVSANHALRTGLNPLGEVYFPEFSFCTDNGAMIAYAGAQHLLAGHRADLSIQIFPRWPLTTQV